MSPQAADDAHNPAEVAGSVDLLLRIDEYVTGEEVVDHVFVLPLHSLPLDDLRGKGPQDSPLFQDVCHFGGFLGLAEEAVYKQVRMR